MALSNKTLKYMIAALVVLLLIAQSPIHARGKQMSCWDDFVNGLARADEDYGLCVKYAIDNYNVVTAGFAIFACDNKHLSDRLEAGADYAFCMSIDKIIR
jgi:hypothetical protein